MLAIILTVAVPMVSSAPDSDAESDWKCGNDLSWDVSEGTVLTIRGTGPMYDYDSLNSSPWPNTISTVVIYGATSIGKCAFY